MKINLNRSTKILELIKEFPFLMDSLIELSPKLKKLKNPILQKTIGRQATIFDVSSIGKININTLFEKIGKELIEKGNVEVSIDKKDEKGKSWVKVLEERQNALKEIVLDLHKGEENDVLQKRFTEIIQDVTASEIAEMEQNLIEGGELTPEQVTSMCDLHVKVFKESLDEHEKPESIPGHPLHTYMKENEYAKNLITNINENKSDLDKISNLKEIITHYTRLENQLFPILEKEGISGPSTVMWAIHDEIRENFRNLEKANVEELLTKIDDMIYKENTILYPMALETLSEKDWIKVQTGEEEIGYSWIKPGNEWKPITSSSLHQLDEFKENGLLKLKTGNLSLKQIDLMLRNLPIDISFIDAKEEVAYYSNTEERIFPRSPGVIGRKVQFCHPQKSIDKVQQIIDSFRKGTKDVAEFWIQVNDKFIFIRYFAIHDDNGEFLGTLEVSQDITDIRKLKGEKRLLDW
ncbi:MAG: DUF438 domain-containing protein [archaeon]|nr:DUF438 domain-containing protein [archaeon]